MIFLINFFVDFLNILVYVKDVIILQFPLINNYFLLFVGFSFLFAIINSCCVLITNNPVNAVLHMILSFIVGSFLFFALRVDFFGYIFLIVYVGAIAVLFLFIVMMFDIKIKKTNASFLKFINNYFWKILIVFSMCLIFIKFTSYSFENRAILETILSKITPIFRKDLVEYILFFNEGETRYFRYPESQYNSFALPIFNNESDLLNERLLPAFKISENNLLHYVHLIKIYDELFALLILSGIILLIGMVGSIVLAMSSINVNLDLEHSNKDLINVKIKRQEMIQQYNRHSKIARIFFKVK